MQLSWKLPTSRALLPGLDRKPKCHDARSVVNRDPYSKADARRK
jgi:hypothetical protein